jgi:hypothetical protein
MGTFDHRGKHRFLADVGIVKEGDVGEQERNAVQPPQGNQGFVEFRAEFRAPVDGGLGGRGAGTKAFTFSPTVVVDS